MIHDFEGHSITYSTDVTTLPLLVKIVFKTQQNLMAFIYMAVHKLRWQAKGKGMPPLGK